MNDVKTRAANRIQAITYSSKRIKQKMKDLPNDTRMDAWKERLRQYTLSLKALELELETGQPMRIGGASTADGVTISPDPALVKLKGGSNDS